MKPIIWFLLHVNCFVTKATVYYEEHVHNKDWVPMPDWGWGGGGGGLQYEVYTIGKQRRMDCLEATQVPATNTPTVHY